MTAEPEHRSRSAGAHSHSLFEAIRSLTLELSLDVVLAVRSARYAAALRQALYYLAAAA
ncbi:MAG: hypothetical protein ACE1ZZ_04280 [Dehalococcoidia bacterium]